MLSQSYCGRGSGFVLFSRSHALPVELWSRDWVRFVFSFSCSPGRIVVEGLGSFCFLVLMLSRSNCGRGIGFVLFSRSHALPPQRSRSVGTRGIWVDLSGMMVVGMG